MSTVVCKNCQTENEAEAELCVVCGQPLAPVTPEGQQEDESQPIEREAVEEWVRQLPEFGKLDAESPAHEDEGLPTWLQNVRAHADRMTNQEAEELLDFLAALEPGEGDEGGKKAPGEAGEKGAQSELPSWVAALLPDAAFPKAETLAAMAKQFAEAQEERSSSLPPTAPLPSTKPLEESREMEGIPDRLAGENLPDWLASQQPAETEEEVEEEEPIAWPGRTRRQRTAWPDTMQQELEKLTEPEPGAGVGEIDSVLDEVKATSMDASDLVPEPSDEDSDMAGWTDTEHTAALEQTLEEVLDLPEAEPSQERVDQWLDILEALPGEEESESLSEMSGEADLDAVVMPDWIESVRADLATRHLEEAELGQAEEGGPLAGLRGLIPAATINLTGAANQSVAGLVMSKEQREQAALLRGLTAPEPDKTLEKRPDADSFLTGRLVLGLALLLLILLALLAPGVADLLPQPDAASLPPQAAQAHEAITAAAGHSALVAFDYTPSMAGELDAVADALLADIAANDIEVATLSQVAAGLPMADRATTANEELSSSRIGYLPGEASGLRALGACLRSGCQALAGRTLPAEARAALADASLIVVLTGDRDSLVGWIEQVGTQSEVKIVAGVTQALGPIARPYMESQQLAGLVEGLPVSVAYDQAGLGTAIPEAGQLSAVTLAQWLAVGVLLAGLVYFGFVAPPSPAVTKGSRK